MPGGGFALARTVRSLVNLGGSLRQIVFGIIAIALSACSPWHCDFTVKGACVEFETTPTDIPGYQARLERLLELEMPFWGVSDLNGWRIQYRNTEDYLCYLVPKDAGCTDYVEHTLSVYIPQDAPDCFEAAQLLHELGHYTLGDPTHTNPKWKDVDGQFAADAWDRPDAPASCVSRWGYIYSGVWTVNTDGF